MYKNYLHVCTEHRIRFLQSFMVLENVGMYSETSSLVQLSCNNFQGIVKENYVLLDQRGFGTFQFKKPICSDLSLSGDRLREL